MPPVSFGIKLNDVLVTDLPVSRSDTLGLQVEQTPIPGLISLYEEHTVRCEAGYTIQEWYNLSSRDRALEVAVSRIKAAVEYQKQKEQERAMKRKKG